MANRVISISHELNEKLKLEDNASGLISSLLKSYYETKNVGLKIHHEQEDIKKLEEELDRKKKEYYQILESRKIEEAQTEELEKHKEFKRKQAEELRNSILEEIERQNKSS